jgi:hypothetical protein
MFCGVEGMLFLLGWNLEALHEGPRILCIYVFSGKGK